MENNEKKINKIISFIFKTKKRIITTSITLLILVLGVIGLFLYVPTPQTDTKALNKLLEEASDLTTAKLKITGITDYEDTGLPVLTKSGFIMVYEATVWAGIDMSKIEIKADDINKIIHVKIPKATIQNKKVEPDSITYFDEEFSLFNVNSKEDANVAQKKAEEDAEEEAKKTGILDFADKQSEALIKGLLINAIPEGYSITTKVVK